MRGASSSVRNILRHVVCCVLLAVGAGFHFFLNLLENYLSLDRARDSFYLDAIAVLLFGALLLAVIIHLVILQLKRKLTVKRAGCVLAFLVCAVAGSLLRTDLLLWADRAFLYMNEARFRGKVADWHDFPVLVHSRSAANFHKAIFYEKARATNDRPLSASEARKVAGQLFGVEGCGLDPASLGRGFYVMRVYC